MSPTKRRLLELLRDGEWHSGNELAEVAGYRYSARLNELKEELGIGWEKRRVRGSVPLYHLVERPVQLTLLEAS